MESNNKKSIAEKMKYFRKIKNMTQDDLAQASGVNVSLIRKYEANFRNPKFEQIQLIAAALDVNPLVFYDIDFTTIGDAMALISKLDEHARLTVGGEQDENGKFIPSTMKLTFQDTALNRVLAQYATFAKLSKKRSDDDHTVDVDESIRLLMNQTKLKKPKG